VSLFECTRCHAVENTALAGAGYWLNSAEGKPVLCSECVSGKWHGQFEKKLVGETRYVTVTDGPLKGTLEPPGGWR
jgi:hypothetical protein